MSVPHNPFYHGATQLLGLLDPNHYHTRAQFDIDARALAASLGLTCDTSRMDNGTVALVLLLGLLREHGASLAMATAAHNQLHQP